jgi:hypothetical protein
VSPAARYSLIGSGALAPLLSGCAAGPRLYSASELESVADRCGLAPSEVDQLGDKRFLFLMKPAPSDAERACISRWGKRRGLHVVIIESAIPPLGPNDI